MAPRKSSTKSHAKATTTSKSTSTPRRSTRNTGVTVDYANDGDGNSDNNNDDSSTAQVKQEPTSSSRKGDAKANIGVKRAAASPAPQESESKKSKRVKTEVKTEVADEEVKIKTVERDEDEPKAKDEAMDSDSELSDVKSGSEVDSELSDEDEDEDVVTPSKKSKGTKTTTTKVTPAKKTKIENVTPGSKSAGPSSTSKSKSTTTPNDKEAALQAKKLKTYSQFSKTSPFPDFPHPTPDEARLAHKILASIHGERKRPEKVVARDDVAGCGDSPSVLDALVRTILSQNTSDKNSTRAKLSMNKVYGGSDEWAAIAKGGREMLQETIKSGGLAVVKSKVIISILEQVMERYGKYSLDHLFEKTDEEAMAELIGYKGVGPKTASCVLLFCLQRESFAVDTHVYRIAGLLGWRPKSATRDQTHAHLEVMIPDEDKYGLHILMVGHGKKCDECKAGGKSVGKCELRKAFRKGKLEGEAGEDVKEEEEEEVIKEEEGNDEEDGKENVEDGVKEEWESGQEDYVHGMETGKSKSKGGKKKAKGRK